MVKIVCWNIAISDAAYPALQEMDADVALLQEVGPGAAEQMQGALGGREERWDWGRRDRWPAVAKLSDRVEVERFHPVLSPSVDAPLGTRNVPTHHSNRASPETARNQLDYAFVSVALARA